MKDASRDRRRALRRRTVPAAHGTRRRYQLGCDCLPCRAANAAYVSQQRRAAVPSLGTCIPAGPAKKRVRQLKAEGFTDLMLAAELGVRQFNLRGNTVTLRTYLQLEDLYQRRVADVGTFVTKCAQGVDFDDRPPLDPREDDPRVSDEEFVSDDREVRRAQTREREVTGRRRRVESRAR